MAEEALVERKISAHQVEYAAGGLSWMKDAVNELKLQLHPILAETQREQVADLPRPEEHSSETAELASPLYRGIPVQHKISITLDDMIEGNVDALLSVMFEMADEMGKQLTAGMFAHISEVSDAYGQTINVGEEGFVEAYIRSLESVEMSFNADGSPATKLYVHPDSLDVLIKNPPTPEQQQRIDDIVNRKREEWHASRRRQDLP